MTITLIAMVDMADGIGDDKGNLLFNIPKDMAHFKRVTKDNIVVMGRKTWDSLPKKPLKHRDNYVLTNNKNFKANGATVVHSVGDILKLAESNDVFIIGGEMIYNQFFPYADRLIMTHVHAFNFNATTFFPDFSYKEWKLVEMEKFEETDKHPSFAFTTYIKKD